MNPVKKYAERHTKYLRHTDSINLGYVTFPVKISKIGKVVFFFFFFFFFFFSYFFFFFFLVKLMPSIIYLYQCSNGRKRMILLFLNDMGLELGCKLIYIRDEYTGHFLLINNFNGFMSHSSKHNN